MRALIEKFNELPAELSIAAIMLVALAAMWLIKSVLLRRIKLLADQTKHPNAKIVLRAIARPANIAILVAGIILFEYLLAIFSISSPRLESTLSTASKILLILALVLFADRFFLGLLSRQTARTRALKNSTSIIRGIVRALILGTGLLIILSNLGISITPLIASLGITSLAVALALQPTLENFFSGVQLVMDKPIRIGDYIELESGEQGYVEKIGWRSTWIKMLPNNTVIMPNSVLSQSKIINYYYPSRELSVPVEVGVHYSSDLDKVEQICLEEARKVLKQHDGGVESYNTFVLFHTFADSSVNLTVMLRAQEYVDRFFLKSDFVKALHKRFGEEGIVIPFPIRAINLSQEQAGSAATDLHLKSTAQAASEN